ncbi:hypothetical protein ACFXPS_17900 [Nocardia sp. NPDC059091]|uniref:hypothetical protein n=1 Tax=Nocardia sp. NPDC059091 TaxID=3346724 RepID=UPI0036988531
MNHQVGIPSPEQARRVTDEVLAAARPSVLAVARELGLSNTTFRRHFPELVREIGETRRAPQVHSDKPSPFAVEHARLATRNARLRRENRQLRYQLSVAVTSIRQLTLINHSMKLELEAASNITRIAKPGRAR